MLVRLLSGRERANQSRPNKPPQKIDEFKAQLEGRRDAARKPSPSMQLEGPEDEMTDPPTRQEKGFKPLPVKHSAVS